MPLDSQISARGSVSDRHTYVGFHCSKKVEKITAPESLYHKNHSKYLTIMHVESVCLSVSPSSAFPVAVAWSRTLIAAFESLGFSYVPPPCPHLPPWAALENGVELLSLLSPLIVPSPTA